ncbi:MAG: alpha/beta fold hydrolase [Anaerolineae bacterium]|nr:lysophospholipase [Anaerolineae bacterium]MDW8067412.1 alpha/beta fold hydrolase [Anaerolineae bacterium]
MSFQTFSAKVNYRAISLHLTVYESGPGRPSVVFIPGMGSHAGSYTDLIPGANVLRALAEEGFNVVAVDLQGHGRSGGPRGLFTYADLLGNISCAIDYVVEQYGGPVGVTGSSMGGILAFYAGLTDSRVMAVVCHNVADLQNIRPVLYLRRHRLVVPLAETLSPWLIRCTWLPIPITAFLEPRHVFDRPENVRHWQRDPLFVPAYRASSWVSLFLYPQDKPAVEAMTRPVRIIVGENDRILPVKPTQAFYDRLRCPRDLVIIPGAGHMLLLEYLPTTVPLVAEGFRLYL